MLEPLEVLGWGVGECRNGVADLSRFAVAKPYAVI